MSVFYSLQYKVALLDTKKGVFREKDDRDPIIVRQIARNLGFRQISCFWVLSRISGVALAFGDKTLVAIGRESNIDLLQYYWKATTRAISNSDLSLSLLYSEAVAMTFPKTPTEHEDRQRKRIALLTIQHTVALEYPDLRIWREGKRKPGEPEVLLKPYCPSPNGGLIHLGGIIWNDEYYTSGQYLTDLAVKAPQPVAAALPATGMP
jgi:hypothetical protein